MYEAIAIKCAQVSSLGDALLAFACKCLWAMPNGKASANAPPPEAQVSSKKIDIAFHLSSVHCYQN